MNHKKSKWSLFKCFSALVLTLVMVLSLFSEPIWASETIRLNFYITNPYADVDCDTVNHFRAALHVHTTHSHSSADMPDIIRDHYLKGFDILAITDHDVLTLGWDRFPVGNLRNPISIITSEEKQSIYAGTWDGPRPSGSAFTGSRQQQNGMISIPASNEQSRGQHLLTFWAPFNNMVGDSLEDNLQWAERLGGVSIIVHKGRYTEGRAGGEDGLARSNDRDIIERYVELYFQFPSLLGMEIFNRFDHYTRSDRVLWDNILMETMPFGRNVFGFSNDDSHGMDESGYNFNVLLMPVLHERYARVAMESGAFYAVTRVARHDNATTPGIHAPTLPNGDRTPNIGNALTAQMLLYMTTPSIARITAEDNVITILGRDYDRIDWIADGVIIHRGSYLYIPDFWEMINHNYVRAQLVSESGLAFTQPFGVFLICRVILYPDDGKTGVTVPDLPGCHTYGNTTADALFMAKDAMERTKGVFANRKLTKSRLMAVFK